MVMATLREIAELCQIFYFTSARSFQFYYGAAGQGGGGSRVSVAHRHPSGDGCTTRRLDQ